MSSIEPYRLRLLRERLFFSFRCLVGFWSFLRRLPTTELACRFISNVADFLTDLVDLRERVDRAEGRGCSKYSTPAYLCGLVCRDLPVAPVLGEEKSDKSCTSTGLLLSGVVPTYMPFRPPVCCRSIARVRTSSFWDPLSIKSYPLRTEALGLALRYVVRSALLPRFIWSRLRARL